MNNNTAIPSRRGFRRRPIRLTLGAAVATATFLLLGTGVATATTPPTPTPDPDATVSNSTQTPDYNCSLRTERDEIGTPGSPDYRQFLRLGLNCQRLEAGVKIRGTLVFNDRVDTKTAWLSGSSTGAPDRPDAVTHWIEPTSYDEVQGMRLEVDGVSEKSYTCSTWTDKNVIDFGLDEYRVALGCSWIDPNVSLRGVLDRAGAGDSYTPWIGTNDIGKTLHGPFWATYPEPRGTRVEAKLINQPPLIPITPIPQP